MSTRGVSKPQAHQAPLYRNMRQDGESAAVQLAKPRYRKNGISESQARWRDSFTLRSGYRPPREDE